MRTPRLVTSRNPRIEARRAAVAAWLLNGFVHQGKILKQDELAIALRTRPETVAKDITVVRRAMLKTARSAPALQNLLKETLVSSLQMIQEDRGRALEQYERVRAQVYAEDGTPRRIIGEDMHELSYTMAAFMKILQESTKQMISAVNTVAGRPVFIQNNTVNNTSNVQNNFSMTDAIRLLEEQPGGVRALPTSTMSAVPTDLDFVDYGEALA